MEENNICKRCLLKDIAEYYKSVYEYIDSIPAHEKAPEEEYKRRLDICLDCEHTSNAMCGLCGCFIEVRAVKKNSYCAKSDSIW